VESKALVDVRSQWPSFGGSHLVRARIANWGERWEVAEIYDSMNYLGTGLFAGLAFWWLRTGSSSAH